MKQEDNEYKTCPDCCYDILDDEGDVMEHECISDNEMIAEFMSGQRVLPDEDVYNMPTHNNLCYGVNELQYDTSWDWLMPVVEKIESLGYELIIAESRCKINHNTDHSIEEVINIDIIDSKREATYQAVVEFIKEHNDEQ